MCHDDICTMTNAERQLTRLYKNLNILLERKAAYAGQAPLALLNQIDHHRQAITLTEQWRDGHLAAAEWREAMKPLLVSVEERADKAANSVTIGNISGGIHGSTIAGGDVNEVTIDRLVANIFEDDTALGEQRVRHEVIAVMQRLWIEPTLGGQSLSPFRLERLLDAVDHPWAGVVNLADQQRELLPPGTTLSDVLENADGSLLVLGEPACGKTTQLLDLARQALEAAAQNRGAPLPVILSLSGWRKDDRSLKAWLAQTLILKYYLTAEAIQTWLDNDELFVLLDELDRIETDRARAACVAAINTFNQEHSLTSLVVCCRTGVYQALPQRLQLSAAVRIVRPG